MLRTQSTKSTNEDDQYEIAMKNIANREREKERTIST